MDNARISCNTRLKEVLKPNQVNVTKHDFVFGFPHQQATVHGAVFLEQRFGALLELLWTDLLCSHAFWNDQ